MGLLQNMPPVIGTSTRNRTNGRTSDIIKAIENNFNAAVLQSVKIASSFKRDTQTKTAAAIWSFLRKNIQYIKDTSEQNIKMPNRFLSDKNGDCKSFTLFAGSILKNLGLPVVFRYASYSGSSIPTHVYAVTNDEKGNEIIIDGVYDRFNAEAPYFFKTDKLMNVNTLAGPPARPRSLPPVNPNSPNYSTRLNNRLRVLPAGSVCALLVEKELSRLRGQRYSGATPDRGRLESALQMFSQPNNICAYLIRKELSPEVAGIGRRRRRRKRKGFLKKLGKKIKGLKLGKGLKKISLAPARNAYLALVKLNIRGLATSLSLAPQSSVSKKWKRLGGNPRNLYRAVNSGKRKKRILGLGFAPEAAPAGFAATLAIAAPIILALAPLLKQIKFKNKEGKEFDLSDSKILEAATQAAESAGVPTEIPGNAEVIDVEAGAGESAGAPDGEDTGSRFELSPGLLLGAGALALIAFSKK